MAFKMITVDDIAAEQGQAQFADETRQQFERRVMKLKKIRDKHVEPWCRNQSKKLAVL